MAWVSCWSVYGRVISGIKKTLATLPYIMLGLLANFDSMQVFDDLITLRQRHPHCVATIGKYDGMHLGHQHILHHLLARAEACQQPALVILSEPQPEEFFNADTAPARLMQFHQKVAFLDRYGVDLVYRMTFDQALSELEPNAFVEKVLVKGLGVTELIVGDDFRFGKNRAGDFSVLCEAGKRFGFHAESIPACLLDGERVSSTRVRQHLESGDCEAVTALLGRPYQLGGVVVTGKKLGRELGFPTANIDVGMSRVALEGIFAVAVEAEGAGYQGVASVGYKPSIAGEHDLAVEVYLFEFSGDLYGKMLNVGFLKKIRSQERFSDLEELKRNISNDVEQVKQYFAASLTDGGE